MRGGIAENHHDEVLHNVNFNDLRGEQSGIDFID